MRAARRCWPVGQREYRRDRDRIISVSRSADAVDHCRYPLVVRIVGVTDAWRGRCQRLAGAIRVTDLLDIVVGEVEVIRPLALRVSGRLEVAGCAGRIGRRLALICLCEFRARVRK